MGNKGNYSLVFYPFVDAHVLTSQGLMEYRCQSAQQASLTYLTSCGPSAVVSPGEAHAMCTFSGLIPQENHLTTTGSSMVSFKKF